MQRAEEELRSRLADALGVMPVTEPVSDAYFELLEARFPMAGSKIDWSRVPGALARTVEQTDAEAFRIGGVRFFEEVRGRAQR